jgi:hypothetical protein
MKNQRGEVDVFAVISIATLVVIVAGIAVGVIQWRSYERRPEVKIEQRPDSSGQAPDLVREGSAPEGGGASEPETLRPEGEDGGGGAPAPDVPPADKPEEPAPPELPEM